MRNDGASFVGGAFFGGGVVLVVLSLVEWVMR